MLIFICTVIVVHTIVVVLHVNPLNVHIFRIGNSKYHGSA